jgi:hypothetical protein
MVGDFVESTPDRVLFDVGEGKRNFKTRGFDYLAFLNKDERSAIFVGEVRLS